MPFYPIGELDSMYTLLHLADNACSFARSNAKLILNLHYFSSACFKFAKLIFLLILVMAENSLDYLSKVDMTRDIAMGKAIADFLNESKADPNTLKRPLPEPEISQVMHIRDYRRDVALCNELGQKLKSMIEENSSNSEEKNQLYRDMQNYIKIEKRRENLRRIVTLNRRRGQLKRVWASRDMPVDEESLQSAASKDVFDMSSLDESLPSKPGESPTKKKAEKLAKEYLSVWKKKRRSYRKSEILRILASTAPEQNNNSASSSITRMMKKVCGDVKNVGIFSFRPLIKKHKDSNSCVDSKGVSCPELRDLEGKSSLQNVPLHSKKAGYTLGRERLILLKSTCELIGKTDSAKLRNPKCLLFNRNQQDNKVQRSVSVQTQQLHDSISISRQLSRLKITNSRRSDLSEAMDESEIQEASVDQNKDEQEKVETANRRRELLGRLRESYRSLKQDEREALKKN